MKYISQLLSSCLLATILLLAPACCNRVGCDSACAPRCAPACGDCTTDCPVASPECAAPMAEEQAAPQPAEAPVDQAQLPSDDQALAAEGDYEMSYDAEEATAPTPAPAPAAPQPVAVKETAKPVKKVNDDLSK